MTLKKGTERGNHINILNGSNPMGVEVVIPIPQTIKYICKPIEEGFIHKDGDFASRKSVRFTVDIATEH